MLVVLSVILTAAVLFPALGDGAMIAILAGGGLAGVALWLGSNAFRRGDEPGSAAIDRSQRDQWRMPPLENLPPRHLGARERIWLIVLRAYLILAAGLVLVRIASLAAGTG